MFFAHLLPKILLSLLILYVLLMLLACSLQKRMTYAPSAHIEYNPRMMGLEYEEIHFPSAESNRAPRVDLHAWFVPAKDSRGVLLFCHGNGGNISHRLDSILQFHQIGLDVFIFDYRGYGRSGGSPSEAGLSADARGAWEYLTRERGVEPGRILLFGRSLGGAVAASIAENLEGPAAPAALILESTFTSLPDVGARLYPWLPVRLLSREKYPTLERLERIHVPVLVCHSPDDEVVAYVFGKRLYEAAKVPKQFLEMRGGHNSGYLEMGEAYKKAILDFVESLNQPE
jgi:fermentation-respiration switch protein FrsA (DUF1100 family)